MVTNYRCVAEQPKSDKVENVAMGGAKFGKFCKSKNFESVLIDDVKFGKVGKSESSKTDEEKIGKKRHCASQSSRV